MTSAIEQLIKMHDPHCVSIESLNIVRGRATLTKEQIVAAFATCQHRHPVGFDILMTKYRTAKRNNAYALLSVCGCIDEHTQHVPLLPTS